MLRFSPFITWHWEKGQHRHEHSARDPEHGSAWHRLARSSTLQQWKSQVNLLGRHPRSQDTWHVHYSLRVSRAIPTFNQWNLVTSIIKETLLDIIALSTSVWTYVALKATLSYKKMASLCVWKHVENGQTTISIHFRPSIIGRHINLEAWTSSQLPIIPINWLACLHDLKVKFLNPHNDTG